jgi:hypothetical protein
VDGLSFEQWVLFVAISFRDQYRAHAARAFPDVAAQLPLNRGGKLTVVQVNGGDAVHFIYTGTATKQHTDARHLLLEPPEGFALRDWALLHGEGYKRFVERTLGLDSVGHFVLFPDEDDARATALLEADRIVREHALAVGHA